MRRRTRIVQAAVFSSLAALLLIASPGGALAQTVAQDQYVTQDQYSGGDAQQVPVGPEDPVYPSLTSPAPSSVPPSAPAQSSPAAQDQYSDGATTPAPSSAPPTGPPADPPRAPEVVPEGPASPGPGSRGPGEAGSSQVPVGPGDPAHPGLVPQAQQTLGQTLADVSADLGGIGQGPAALGRDPAATDAQSPAATDPSAAVPAFSAPTTAVVSGASPGQPPVAVVDPYSAAVNAASAVGGGAPGYTTWGQPPSGVAVLGGPPQQDRQAPVAVVDPYSAAVGAVSPSVPGETAQVAQVLQQLLTQRDAMLAAQQQGVAGNTSLEAALEADLARDVAEWYRILGQAMLNPASTGPMSPGEMANQGNLGELLAESYCYNPRIWSGAPDGSDLDHLGHDMVLGPTDYGDVAEACNVW